MYRELESLIIVRNAMDYVLQAYSLEQTMHAVSYAQVRQREQYKGRYRGRNKRKR